MNTLSGTLKLDTPMPEFEFVYPHPLALIPDPSKQKKFACLYTEPRPHILSDPYQLPCGHIICKPCIEKNIKDREITCPLAECNSRINIKDIFVDAAHARDINGLVVECLEPKCSWKGEFKNYKQVHVYNCSGSPRYMIEEIKYLKKRYEHNIQIQPESNTDSDALKEELENTIKENKRLTEQVQSQNQKIKLLDGELEAAKSENCSLSTVISTIVNDQQLSVRSGYNSHTPNTETKAGTPKVKMDNVSKVVPPATVTQTSASAGAGNIIYSWQFDHAENLNKTAGIIQNSEPFQINNHTFQLLLVKQSHEYLSLYVRVINGDNDGKAEWPCSESMKFIMKDHSKHKTDIIRTIHLSRAPGECRSSPGKAPHPLVGFKEFCRLSTLQPPKGDYQRCYLDSDSKTTIDVLSAAQIKPNFLNSPYDVIEGIGLISWPIRNYSQKVNGNRYSDHVLESPVFYTSYEGYCFKLILNLEGTYRSNKTRAVICAQVMPGKHDEKLTWPVSGGIKVSLLDRRHTIENHQKEDISTVIPVNSKNRVVQVKSCYDEHQARTDTIDFFRLMPLQSDQKDLGQPIYKFNDEIVIRAEFIPF
ncbi:hypothetical protein [Salinisphaera sp. G21_0]|uniref:hypothetical protein n=1 Tax=Salinisphaera sp. G21_0 TaxID=2821094 RepID=UPI001ADAF9F6|nr:hypothetical protein [Salinisphaera sp. G21_0]MBO9482258.1 hypothetical protein [Salinisphaera sp. G21_0]